MTRKAAILLVLVASLLPFGSSFAESIAFKQNLFTFQLTPGTDFSVDLRSLLAEEPGIALIWTTSGARPAFFEFSAANETFSARPTEANFGTYNFRLVVRNPVTDDGSIAEVRVVVSDAPRWARVPLPLGVQVVGTRFSIDLKKEILNPQADLKFRAQRLRSWMVLSPDGILSGTPTAQDLGDYSEILLTAETSRGSSENTAFGAVVRPEAKLTLLGSKWLPVGACRKITVSQEDGTGNPLLFAFDRRIDLVLSGPAAATSRIFGDEACSAPAITHVNIASGKSRVDVYARATVEGEVLLTANSAPLQPASLALFAIAEDAVLALSLSVTDKSERALTRTCVALDVQLTNGRGAAFAAPFDTAVVLGSDSAKYGFYADDQCAAQVSQVIVPRGASGAKAYITSPDADGIKLLRATHEDYETAELPYQFLDRSAVKLKLTLTKNTLIEGECVRASVRALHALDGDADVLQAIPVDLSANGETADSSGFYSDASCTAETNRVTIPVGAATVAFSFTFRRAGEASVRAQSQPEIRADEAAVTVAKPPKFALAPAALVFGEIFSGQSKELVAVLSNTGAPAAIGAITIAGTEFSIGPTSVCRTGQVLGEEAECEIRVRFSPTTEGAKTGTLTVATPNGSLSVALSGSGAPSEFALAPAAGLSFGDLAVEASKDLIATLSNGGSPGGIGAISLSGAARAEYSILSTSTCTTGQALATGASCQISVRLLPSSGGSKSANLTVVTPNGLLSIPLSGNGVPPKFALAPANGLAFGELLVGQSRELAAILSNSGAAGAIGAMSISGAGFTIAPTTACVTGQVLATDAGCEIRVRFAPTSQGAATGSLSVATGSGVVTIALNGSGAPTQFALAPASGLAFGDLAVGASKDLIATLSNGGSAGAIGAISLAGAARSEYSILGASTCVAGQLLANGASCQIRVRLQPSSGGSKNASLSVVTPNGTLSISLNGTGVPPKFALAPASGLVFGELLVGQSRELAAILSNSGAAGPIGAMSVSGVGFTIAPTTACVTGQTLATDAGCEIRVRFAPTSQGAKTGSLRVVTGSGVLTIALSGSGAPSRFILTPASGLNFGEVPIGGTRDLSAMLTNTGSPAAIGSSVVSSEFSVLPTSTCVVGRILANGTTCEIRVRFSPGSAGAKNGTLTTVSPNGNLAISLKGSGLPPRFSLTPGTSLHFGELLVGASRELVATVNNSGASGSIGTITVGGVGFSIAPTSGCRNGQVLAMGTSCQIRIRFAPTSAGVKAGTLNVSGGGLGITLHGSGTAPGQLAFNPAGSVDLGHLMVPNSNTVCVRAVHVGGLPVDVTGLATTPAQVMRLDSAAGCGVAACSSGTRLNAGQSCAIRVRFAPSGPGAFQEQLVMNYASAGQPGSIGLFLRGSAAVPPPAPSVWIHANGVANLVKMPVTDHVNITWGSAHATSCAMTHNDLAARYVLKRGGGAVGGNWAGPTLYGLSHPGLLVLGGSDPAWRDVTYTLTCTGAGGQSSAAVRVRRYAYAAGGGVQVSYIVGSQAEAEACAKIIRQGAALDPDCRAGSWGTLWADGTRNPWWLKPNTAPGEGRWCSCFNPKTAPAGKPWASRGRHPQ